MRHSVPQFPPSLDSLSPWGTGICACECWAAPRIPWLSNTQPWDLRCPSPLQHATRDSHQHTLEGMLQTLGKKKKEQNGGDKSKKKNLEAEGAGGPGGPGAAGSSRFTLPTRHETRGGHCGNSKFQMALWAFFFFFCLISKATRLAVICQLP